MVRKVVCEPSKREPMVIPDDRWIYEKDVLD